MESCLLTPHLRLPVTIGQGKLLASLALSPHSCTPSHRLPRANLAAGTRSPTPKLGITQTHRLAKVRCRDFGLILLEKFNTSQSVEKGPCLLWKYPQ